MVEKISLRKKIQYYEKGHYRAAVQMTTLVQMAECKAIQA